MTTDIRTILESGIRMKYHDDYGLDCELPAKEVGRIYEKAAEAYLVVVNDELESAYLKHKGLDDTGPAKG